MIVGVDIAKKLRNLCYNSLKALAVTAEQYGLSDLHCKRNVLGRRFDKALRGLSNMRVGEVKLANAVKNTIIAIMDEYFPEFEEVFKNPLAGKASRHILKTCPFPAWIVAMGESGVLAEFRKAVKKTVGAKKASEPVRAARETVGVDYGLTTVRLRLSGLLDELDRHEKRLAEIEGAMGEMLEKRGYS